MENLTLTDVWSNYLSLPTVPLLYEVAGVYLGPPYQKSTILTTMDPPFPFVITPHP